MIDENELIKDAQEIRDEVFPKANTAIRIGSWMLNAIIWVKEYVASVAIKIVQTVTNKTNEVISTAGLKVELDKKADETKTIGGKTYTVVRTEGGTIPEIDVSGKVDKKVIYNVTQATTLTYIDRKTARGAVPAAQRGIGQILSYKLQTGWVTELFIGAALTSYLLDDSWQDVGSSKRLTELIPFSDSGTVSSRGYAFYYLEQSVLRGVPINRIRLNVSRIGTLTISVATGIPNPRTVISSFNLSITTLGDQILTFPNEITLAGTEFLGIGEPSNSAEFLVNTTRANPVAGGYAFYGTNPGFSLTRDLCVGVIATSAILEEGGNTGGGTVINDSSVRGLNKTKEVAVQALSKKIGGLANPVKNNIFSFIQFSDPHGQKEQIRRVFEAINQYSTIPFGINCGDIVASTIVDDFQTYQDIALPSLKTVYHCLGNHDLQNGTTAAANVKFMQPFWAKWGLASSSKNYYYKDIEGVRFIFIDEYESQKSGTSNSYLTDTQLLWLINTLKATTKAIIVTHQPAGKIIGTGLKRPSGEVITGVNNFFDNTTETIVYTFYQNGENPVRDIVEAWKQGTSLNKTYTTSSADLPANVVNVTFTGKQEFICYFTGHEHYDKFGFIENTTQLSCTVSCTKMEDKFSDTPRLEGTQSQDCINAVGINLDDKTVSLVRLGSDVAYDQRERKSISVIYDKSKY
ncbi:metallophosphoesterase family protein [Dysgonomonas sp. HGC4]|uniref:metallophosphoesterase family protein n=1 Tax=Dysgonomonas sp. HGC4 TaxID=1658009 RepID=UPI000683071E|nr:metallophosphoesterase [Dysgonomonas sp. HGC4]MBD8349337.1 metallophosphoesterase [Dysgonomonas sp. HGC4]